MKLFSIIRILAVVCIVILFASACSNGRSQDSNKKDFKSAKATQTSATTTSADTFASKVQSVCTSVDPKVFDAIIKVDPTKDKSFQSKFDEATTALDGLILGFSSITPDVSKAEQWQQGLDSLSLLKSQVDLVSKQYSEYVALLAESETNQDPARTVAILARLLALGGEYTQNLQAIGVSFDTVLKVGSAAGISKCRAFEIGTTAK